MITPLDFKIMKQSPHSMQPGGQHEGFSATAGRILFLMVLFQERDYLLMYSSRNSQSNTQK